MISNREEEERGVERRGATTNGYAGKLNGVRSKFISRSEKEGTDKTVLMTTLLHACDTCVMINKS